MKLIPVLSFVIPHPAPYVGADAQDAADALDARIEAGELRGYDQLGLLERIGFTSTTAIVALVMASVALGPANALRLALADLRVIALGVVGPFSTARAALDAALAHLQGLGGWSTAARLTSVMLAGQVLSIANVQFLLRDRTSARSKSMAKAAAVLLLVMLPVMVMWLLACVVWLFR